MNGNKLAALIIFTLFMICVIFYIQNQESKFTNYLVDYTHGVMGGRSKERFQEFGSGSVEVVPDRFNNRERFANKMSGGQLGEFADGSAVEGLPARGGSPETFVNAPIFGGIRETADQGGIETLPIPGGSIEGFANPEGGGGEIRDNFQRFIKSQDYGHLAEFN